MPFEFYTADDLWTDEYTSQKMLEFHLNETVDASSRNHAFIDRSAAWIVTRFGLCAGTAIADFGCGPGLYTTRLARSGTAVTGIDFSKRSISYARETAAKEGLTITYVNSNYLEFETAERFDLVMMIMCDYCALSPEQRKILLGTFRSILKPGGSVLFDVYSLTAFDGRTETAVYEKNLLGGFWSPETYYGFLNVFKYDPEKVVLDKYSLIEKSRTRTVYNWLQYFSLEALERELAENGFRIGELLSDVAGTPFNSASNEFAVIAV